MYRPGRLVQAVPVITGNLQMGNGIFLFVQKRYVVGGHNSTSTFTVSRIWHCGSEDDNLQPLNFEESDDSMMVDAFLQTAYKQFQYFNH
jgi:hypothetical protein